MPAIRPFISPPQTVLRMSVAALVAGAAIAMTSACAPADDAAPQTRSDACGAVSTAVDEAMSTFGDVDAADLPAAAEATEAVAAQLDRAADAVTEPAVDAALSDLRAGFDALADASSSAATGGAAGLGDLAEATERIRTGVAAFRDLCGA